MRSLLAPLAALLLTACLVQAAEVPAGPPAPSPQLVLPGPGPTLSTAVTAEARLSVRTHGDLPPDAPSVVVHAPAGVALDGLRLVIYLHGWEGCARAVLADTAVPCRPGGASAAPWGLASEHDAAGGDSVLVVPQLAWRARTGTPGTFSRPGVADAWLAALVDELLVPELGIAGPDAIEEIVLVAHSGGYVTTLELLEHGGAWPVRSVVLLDALYGGADRVAAWASGGAGRRAVSLHTDHPGTTGQSLRLAEAVAASRGAAAVEIDPPALAAALRDRQVVVARSPHRHGAIPGAHFRELLTGLL